MKLSRTLWLGLFVFVSLLHAAQEPDWAAAEKGILENHVQLTSQEQFRKAGECYFSPDGTQIIFEVVERKANAEDEERFYQMYVADLTFEEGRV